MPPVGLHLDDPAEQRPALQELAQQLRGDLRPGSPASKRSLEPPRPTPRAGNPVRASAGRHASRSASRLESLATP